VAFWRYFAQFTRTRTRDTSAYGLAYLSGLLRMKSERNITRIAHESQLDPQKMPHFISHSPWDSAVLIEKLHAEIVSRPEWCGGMLILDESGDEKSGDTSAGTARQHNGRLGKVDQTQVGVYLAYTCAAQWLLWDGTLFIPERWFGADYAARRRKVGIPTERCFQTKIELGWQLIAQGQRRGLAFAGVAFDSLYGRSHWLRQQCDQSGIEYYADVPVDYPVYTQAPQVLFEIGKRGQPTAQFEVVGQMQRVSDLASQQRWQALTVRPTDRGPLQAAFARCPVWTVDAAGQGWAETLLLKRESQSIRYSLTNAPAESSLLTLAYRRCQRYFVERSLQAAKSELGLAEFQAQFGFRAWGHHLALTLLASWFITLLRLNWREQTPLDAGLAEDYGTTYVATLSMANVRELLRVALPLRQLDKRAAVCLILGQLVNRTRSRRSHGSGLPKSPI
jgi:SRSO17 transposase